MSDPTKPLAVSEPKKTVDKRYSNGQFAPGNNMSPGRPKRDWTWRDLLEEAAEEMIDVKQKDGKSSKFAFKRLIARKLLTEAANGNIGAVRELINRMDGMPQQKMDIKHEGGVSLLMDTKPEK